MSVIGQVYDTLCVGGGRLLSTIRRWGGDVLDDITSQYANLNKQYTLLENQLIERPLTYQRKSYEHKLKQK